MFFRQEKILAFCLAFLGLFFFRAKNGKSLGGGEFVQFCWGEFPPSSKKQWFQFKQYENYLKYKNEVKKLLRAFNQELWAIKGFLKSGQKSKN